MTTGVPVRPWLDPEMVGWRREPTSTLRRAHDSDTQDLDGTWRFQLLPSPEAVVGEKWATAMVPGCWTTEPAEASAGGGRPDLPWYTNDQMPWPNLPPVPPAQNPTGVYERDVDVPADWDGRRIVLHVGAAESLLVAEVNGVCVGVSTDSHLAAEFDVTDAVRAGERATVRLTVVKWSAGTFVEDQDQWWHGGITRSVRLFSRPALHLADVRVNAGLVADAGETSLTGRVEVDVRVGCDDGRLPPGWRVDVRLGDAPLQFDHDAHTRDAADERLSVYRGRARFAVDVPGVRAWSAEVPELYDLTIELRNADGTLVDTARQRVGFRTVEIIGPDLLFNGQRVFLRGVNRHDWHPLTGRVVTPADMRRDLITLKRFGFNAVRTSHYPNDPVFLDLTDELGFYVVDEANIESHAYAHELCDDPAYLPAFTQRVARMVRRDRNHPSVVIWSLGNESDYGANHDAVAAWLRRDDPTRPVQYEGAIKDDWTAGQAASDIVCPMYASIDELVEHVTRQPPTRPVVLCEYSHAMGNSNGSLADYWTAIETHPGLQGGFIWELTDHGLLQRESDGMPAGRAGAGHYAAGRPAPGFRWAHGGDFGDTPNDGAFCLDGLLLPDGTPKPAALEHRELAAPLRMSLVESPGGVRVRLRNHQDVRDLEWLTATWWFSGADGTVREAPAELPALPPGAEALIDVPDEVVGSGRDVESSIVLIVVTAHDLPWAPTGTEVCLPYVSLPADQASPQASAPVATKDEAAGASRLPEIDDDGRLRLLGVLDGPRLSLWREPTDNDLVGGVARRWSDLGLDVMKGEVVDIRREPDATIVLNRWSTAAGDVLHEQRFGPAEPVGGTMAWRCDDRVELPESLVDLPRIGVVLRLAAGLETMSWFGHGPWETYPDRCAAPVGLHIISRNELSIPYVRAQENGGRHGVRWARIEGPEGGVRVTFARPAQVCARGPVLHLDAVHRGLGTASCGPDALPAYRTTAETLRWTWWLSTW